PLLVLCAGEAALASPTKCMAETKFALTHSAGKGWGAYLLAPLIRGQFLVTALLPLVMLRYAATHNTNGGV
ncbi:MAG: hypothetical protein ABIU63_06340, partial [Chitinophagaceae bacterium]